LLSRLAPLFRLAAVPVAAASVALAATQDGGVPPEFPGHPEVSFERVVLPVLERNCARCHEGEDGEGGVDFSLYLDESEALAAPELWERVGWEVWKHAMPPPNRREQPTDAERDALLAWIDAKIAPLLPAAPPPPALRRLSNAEYAQAVRDLTGVEFDVEAFFPADPVASGFDNQGVALSLSANRLEKYVSAAEAIAAQAVHLAEPQTPPVTRLGGASLRGGRANGGAAALYSSGTVEGVFHVPRSGRYRWTITAWGTQAGPESCRMALVAGRRPIEEVEVAAVRNEPGRYSIELQLDAGTQVLGAAFVNDYYKPEAEDPAQRDRNLFIEGMELEGPLDPLPPTVFQARLSDRHRGDLRRMVAEVAGRAWRRPGTSADIDALLALGAGEGDDASRLRRAVEGILCSPRFLFHTEVSQEDGHARAARLAFFLYGGLPDTGLRAAAESGALVEDPTLRSETRRLLATRRGTRALADGFATQWLQLRNLEDVQPDPERFPGFDDELRASMREETLRLFRHVLDEKLPIAELLTADYGFLDERLAEHYGIALAAAERGDDGWQRVDLSTTPRRGVLGHASVLTLTSTPVRTSPVMRGKWLLEALLDAPTPPPPPGVGTLDDGRVDSSLAPREQLAMHRERRECAVCHDTLDPLGLALENYGPTGRWREQDGAFAVDASAVLPDGRALEGPLELADALVTDMDAITRGLACRLASYALGRPVGPADRRWLQDALVSLPEGSAVLADLVETIAWETARLPPAASSATPAAPETSR
jgi:hypothetical protein